MAYARMGENEKATDALINALQINPENAAANFNMGLIKAEKNDFIAAEKYLRAALRTDPHMAQAAYNLAIILSKDRLDESIIYCKKAATLRPYDSKFAYTAAYFQERSGDLSGAASQLNNLLRRNPNYRDAYILLGDVLERLERKVEAETAYNRGLSLQNLPPQFKIHFQMRLEALKRANRSLGTK
jgi:Flp pilus assembly protein TadD